MTRSAWLRAIVAVVFVLLALWVLLYAKLHPELLARLDVASLLTTLQSMGWWGPLAVIALMVAAIVASPLPSAPIALAAGAAYGHVWGTVYVLIGSELGALLAFSLARYLGYDFVHRHFGVRLSKGIVGSQPVLMATVFASRLLPFISFDLVSYAAGLSVLSLPRFAAATFAGILPASFLLAHLGAEASEGNGTAFAIAVVLFGGAGMAPLAVHVLARRRTRS
jgi:uncharacterized membrane protein YdjX (TVP38/TMEM64 family)